VNRQKEGAIGLGITAALWYSSSMKMYALAVALAVLVVGCGEKSSAPPVAKKKVDLENNSSGNPVTAPVDYLGAVAKAKRTSIKVVDVTTLKRAIDTFKQEEDRYPKDLNELVSKQYMPALPAPPYQMKYQYDAATGDLKVVPMQ
jgi:hypothetical protein